MDNHFELEKNSANMFCKGDKLVVVAGFKNFELGSERGK